MPRPQIDQRFFDTPYYIIPSGRVGQEAFAVIREAMRGIGLVALGRLVLSKRERVIALEAYDKGLLGTTLRYPYEVRKAEDYFCDLPELAIAPEMRTASRLDSPRRSLLPRNQRSQRSLREISNPPISAVQILLQALSEGLQFLWRLDARGDHIPKLIALAREDILTQFVVLQFISCRLS